MRRLAMGLMMRVSPGRHYRCCPGGRQSRMGVWVSACPAIISVMPEHRGSVSSVIRRLPAFGLLFLLLAFAPHSCAQERSERPIGPGVRLLQWSEGGTRA